MTSYTRELVEHAVNGPKPENQKPSGVTLKLDPQPSTSVCAIARAVFTACAAVDVGHWIRTAMCLVPLQLSRCSGNALEPMHDGEPRKDFVEGDSIISMAHRLKLGLYECVLQSHTGPVVVVCALGQQSAGKSYMLNHLAGAMFGVKASRCTDGVWMTARFARNDDGKTILLLFLDCEGIGSPHREELEDILHCLLVGAVSSLTLFKTHFAYSKCAPTSARQEALLPCSTTFQCLSWCCLCSVKSHDS